MAPGTGWAESTFESASTLSEPRFKAVRLLLLFEEVFEEDFEEEFEEEFFFVEDPPFFIFFFDGMAPGTGWAESTFESASTLSEPRFEAVRLLLLFEEDFEEEFKEEFFFVEDPPFFIFFLDGMAPGTGWAESTFESASTLSEPRFNAVRLLFEENFEEEFEEEFEEDCFVEDCL